MACTALLTRVSLSRKSKSSMNFAGRPSMTVYDGRIISVVPLMTILPNTAVYWALTLCEIDGVHTKSGIGDDKELIAQLSNAKRPTTICTFIFYA